jgi:copper chaperone CopZ
MIAEIHHVRGRLRVRTPELKRNDEKARTVKMAMETARGIRSVEVNALTGSLLVYYDPKLLNAEAVLAAIRYRGKLRLGHERVQAGRPLLQAKIANAMLWWAFEKVVERSVPLVIGALL